MLLVKPDTMSLFPRVTRLGQDGHGCVLSAYACVSIASEDEHSLRDESEMWQALPAAIGPGVVFDEGFAKPRAEFLVFGSCHPPQGRADLRGMEVRVSVGEKTKRLQIFGERHFDGKSPMPPRPLVSFPMDWTFAYGGPECQENPHGQGHGALAAGDRLPQILAMQDHEDDLQHARPAGLRAMPPQWPQRARHLGPFDREWLLKDWPQLPASSSKEFFCTAQEDQHFPGYLKGVEHIQIEGMHPDRPRIESSLPGLRCRMFVRRKGAQALEETTPRLDTLWLLPELELAVLCWRGTVSLASDELQELDAFVGGWEKLVQQPQPVQVYEELLRNEEQDEPQEAATPPSEGAAPPPSDAPTAAPADTPEASRQDSAAEPASKPPEPADDLGPLSQLAQELEQAAQEQMAKMGVSQQQVEALLAKKDTPPLPDDFDLQAFAASLEQESRRLMAEKGLAQQDIERLLRQAAEPLKEFDFQSWFAGMESRAVASPQLLENLQQTRQAHEDFLKTMQELEQLTPESAAATPDELSAESSASRESPPSLLPRDGAAEPPPRLDFRNQDLRKASFAKAQLDGADFSGADLRGADFTGALLRKARFQGAICSGADFEACIAVEADFQDADLSACRFLHADFSRAQLHAASIKDSDLSFALFHAADMHMIQAREVLAPYLDCSQADLDGADFTGSVLSAADFSDCSMRGAILRESLLDNACFDGAMAQGALMRSAMLHGSRADKGTDFTGADFRLADCCNARWQDATFTNSNFWGAQLDNASLENTSFHGCVLKAITAQNATLDKADLQNTNLRHANLFHASLRKASLQGARIQHANLFGVDLLGAHMAQTLLDNSITKRTLLDLELLHERT